MEQTELDQMIVIPEKQFSALKNAVAKSNQATIYSRREIEFCPTEDHYFVSATKYHFLLKLVENLLKGDEQ